MPPTEPLAVFHLAEEGAFSEGLVQAARVPDDGRGFIVVLDDDLRTRQMCDCRAARVARPSRPRNPTPRSKVETRVLRAPSPLENGKPANTIDDPSGLNSPRFRLQSATSTT
jgi:hypothetical protein